MALIPWRPFREIENLFEDDDFFFSLVPRVRITEPAMDIYETDKEVVAEVNLPGLDSEKIEVTVEDGTLKISGGAEERKEEKERGYWKRELRRGHFERMVRLPVPVKENEVEATYDKGILKIIMPKAEAQAAKKKIKIKTK